MSSIPLRVQLIDSFLGSNEGIHSIILPDVFSSGGAINVWMDKYARVRRIDGFAAQNPTGVVTNGGGSPTLVRNLFPYRQTGSGAPFLRQMIGAFDDTVNEFELWYSTNEGLTWTFIADLGAGSVGSICSFAQFGNLLFLTNGITTPRVWNGTTLAVAGTTQLAAPATGASGTGVLYGSFKVKIVPRLSDGHRSAGSVASASLSLEGKALAVTWVADPNPNVVGYEEYRTTGTGDVFYFSNYIDGRLTVSILDNNEDIVILENRTLEEHGDPPPLALICVAHKQRMWWLNQTGHPQRGSYSDPGDPDSVWSENHMEFQDAETQGDLIIGAIGNYEGMLVVFEERSIWTVSGTGSVIGNQLDFNRTKTNAQTGAVSNRAIVRLPAGVRFVDQSGKVQTTAAVAIAYMTPLKDIRLFDGDNDIVISHPVSVLAATLNYPYRHRVHTLHDTERSEISWMFPAGIATEPSTAIVWNYRWGVMYERQWTFSAAVQLETANDAAIQIGGSSSPGVGGVTYNMWKGTTFDGTTFRAKWMTKTMYGVNESGQPAPAYQKRFRWVDLLFQSDFAITIDVEWFPGGATSSALPLGSVTISPDTSGLETIDGEALETSDGVGIVLSVASSQNRARFADINGRYLHDNGIRLRMGDSPGNAGSWALEAFTLAYQMLPGLKRRKGARLNP